MSTHELEQQPLQDIMTRWDALDAQIARLREMQDVGLFLFLQDFDQWQSGQNIEWDFGPEDYEYHYVYLTQNEQGQSVQLILTAPSKKYYEKSQSEYSNSEFRVTEVAIDQGNPRAVSESVDWERTRVVRHFAELDYKQHEREDDKEGMVQAEAETVRQVHKVNFEKAAGTTIFQFKPYRMRGESHKTLGEEIVVYKYPEDPTVNLHEPETIMTGYGRTHRFYRISWGMGERNLPAHTELVRKSHPDPDKRVDPIDAGKRTLQLLQKAELLGRFDSRSGMLVDPIRIA